MEPNWNMEKRESGHKMAWKGREEHRHFDSLKVCHLS